MAKYRKRGKDSREITERKGQERKDLVARYLCYLALVRKAVFLLPPSPSPLYSSLYGSDYRHSTLSLSLSSLSEKKEIEYNCPVEVHAGDSSSNHQTLPLSPIY
jgi:hypothetical protein